MRYLFVLLLLSGCATYHHNWAKAGATEHDLYVATGECEAQALQVREFTIRQSAYDACMRGKGWYKK